MKKILSIFLLIFLNLPTVLAYDEIYGELNTLERQVLTFGSNKCKDIKESDIPTIFIPGILASWYSEEGFEESKVKRWIPDPITHAYDTLFNSFKNNGYNLKDVFYIDEFNTYIDGNPKSSLYLFGYDWKKDNKITAKLLSNLVVQVREKYEIDNGCDIGTVNIIAHSMGGLVARAMLEDMCASDEALKLFHNRGGLKQGELKNFVSTSCNNFTRINNFITISTPQRGAPSSFPLWIKGDIDQTDSLMKSFFIRREFGVTFPDEMYKMIHGYSSKLPNGIVTIGQLLPDINKSTNFNNELVYLNHNNSKLQVQDYPINDFLEELNTEENINKMFLNISGKYNLYYSTLTGNNDKNNIIGFNIDDVYKKSNINKQGLYSLYPKSSVNINMGIENIRDEKGIGGDGTVPSKNLLLVANDLYAGGLVKNDKFESIKIKCFEDELMNSEGYDNFEKIENQLTKKLGEIPLELCSHTKMPILTSLQILEIVSGKNIISNLNGDYLLTEEQELLYKYLGYVDYIDERIETYYKSSIVGKIKMESKHIFSLLNNFKVNTLFDNLYYSLFSSENKINSFIKNKNNDDVKRVSINFGGQLGDLIRYEILSPINIIIEDELGRRIGIDPDTGMIINEIPGAWTSGDTEGSNEPEFFLIPKSGSGQVLHKINTFGTGDGEYHIVMNEIKEDEVEGEEFASLVIEGVAKKGEEEKYVVGIEGSKAGFTKVTSENSETFDEAELDKKYSEILDKIISIIDKKYDSKKKKGLKNRLEKFILMKSERLENDEKLQYLIRKIYEHLLD